MRGRRLPRDADEDEGDHLGVGEIVLDLEEIRGSREAGQGRLGLPWNCIFQSTTTKVGQTQRAALTL